MRRRTPQPGGVIDGTASIGIADSSQIRRPGKIDPAQGEEFILEWRLVVNEVSETGLDPSVGLFSDRGWGVGFEFGLDRVVSVFEHEVSYSLTSHVPHAFELRSRDMWHYDLTVDGAGLHQGVFVPVVTQSFVAWGDGIVGAASSASWDYFRFGVVPDVSGFGCLLAVVLTRGTAWSRR